MAHATRLPASARGGAPRRLPGSPWCPRRRLALAADLLEQVDEAVDARGAWRHLAQPVDQALDVLLVEGDALHDLAVSWVPVSGTA